MEILNNKILNINLKNKNFKIKQLLNGKIKKTGGRNNLGHITVRHRGGGFSQLNRLINFKHLIWNLSALVLSVEYCPKRTGFISLICYKNGILSYVISTEGLKVNDLIYIGIKKNINLNDKGFCLPLNNLFDGFFIHNLELNYLKGSQLVRSAGATALVIKTFYNKKQSLIKLPSGEERLFFHNCIATIGKVSNSTHFLKKLRKAGQTRNLGFRPTVRGVAMNPVDHPHGGGQGKTSGAGGYRNQVTFKGLVAKGQSTRNKNKLSNFIVSYRK